VFDHLSSWNEVLPLMEFTYNNSYHASIGMDPYEAFFMGGSARLFYVGIRMATRFLVGSELLQYIIKKIKTDSREDENFSK